MTLRNHCDTCGRFTAYNCHVCGRCVERANTPPRDIGIQTDAEFETELAQMRGVACAVLALAPGVMTQQQIRAMIKSLGGRIGA